MKMLDCPSCGRRTGFKRALGIGTLIAIVLTCGLWILVIPLYPIRCVQCGTGSGAVVTANLQQMSGDLGITRAAQAELKGPNLAIAIAITVLALLGLAIWLSPS